MAYDWVLTMSVLKVPVRPQVSPDVFLHDIDIALERTLEMEMLRIDVCLESKLILKLFIHFYASIRLLLSHSVLTFTFVFVAVLNSFYCLMNPEGPEHY